MAKVVQKSTQKATAVAVSGSPFSLRSDEILVTKEGETRPMRKSVFNLLGSDHNGWKEVTAEKPAEPAKAESTGKGKKAEKEKEPKEPKKPETGNGEGGKSENNAEMIVLTQEHLDLNPKLAEEGKKVGDSVEVESVEVKP